MEAVVVDIYIYKHKIAKKRGCRIDRFRKRRRENEVALEFNFRDKGIGLWLKSFSGNTL